MKTQHNPSTKTPAKASREPEIDIVKGANDTSQLEAMKANVDKKDQQKQENEKHDADPLIRGI